MLTLREYVEFLRFLKENPDKRNRKILEDIIAVRNPVRVEWIDANFKVIKGKLHMHYLHEDVKGKLKPKYTEELKGYLAENKHGIDLDYWIEHATSLGLPPQIIRAEVFIIGLQCLITIQSRCSRRARSGLASAATGIPLTRIPRSGYVSRRRKIRHEIIHSFISQGINRL